MIVFENAGEIDVRSISTFGVSVKEGDNPIGFFGTGLKYAIAVLLRTGHKITILSGMRVVHFGLASETVRGQTFNFVTMSIDNEPHKSIGFTTELGKQWELWMAYREIACNCKDEKGSGRRESYMVDAEEAVTKLIVIGSDFEAVFSQGHMYILEDDPSFVIDGCMEIRQRGGRDYFYRGVRVHQLDGNGLFTYNEISKVDLTEDRTVKNQGMIKYSIAKAWLRCTDEAALCKVVTADSRRHMEGDLDFHGWGVAPSEAFLSVVGKQLNNRMVIVNKTAEKVWQETLNKEFSPTELALTRVQKISMEKAITFCEKIGYPIRGVYPIKVIESLGDGCLGLAKNDVIYIAERVFHIGGTKQLASTLIEEYLHLRHGWKDMSRELQNHLFEKMVSLGEDLIGEPL